MREQRKHHRVDIMVPYSFQTNHADTAVSSKMLNISLGGVGIDYALPLSNGDQGIINLQIDSQTLKLPVEIVNCFKKNESSFRLSAKFVEIAPEQERVLSQFLDNYLANLPTHLKPK